MSRAFTRESDNEKPRPLPELPTSTGPNPVTPRGARRIEEKIREIETALLQADTEALRRELRYWRSRYATMDIIDPIATPDRVAFGTRVTIKRRGHDTVFQIVGQDEADPKRGSISWMSPLARAIDGAKAGETVEMELSGGTEPVTIVSVAGEG